MAVAMGKLLVQEARGGPGGLTTLGFVVVCGARCGALESGDALLHHGLVGEDLAGDDVEAVAVVVDDLSTVLSFLESASVRRVVVDLLSIPKAALRASLLNPLVVSAAALGSIQRRPMPLDDVVCLDLA